VPACEPIARIGSQAGGRSIVAANEAASTASCIRATITAARGSE
jgi:hypothetical protein